MRRFIMGLAAVAVAVAAATAPAEAATKQVIVGPVGFHPSVVRLAPGDSIRFVWRGATPHTLRINSGPAGQRQLSGRRTSGTVTHRFTTAGAYTIVCTLHRHERLKVTVARSGGSPPAPQFRAAISAPFPADRSVSVGTNLVGFYNLSVENGSPFAFVSDNLAYNFAWNFGDAASGALNTDPMYLQGSQAAAFHTYTAPGTYVVTLTMSKEFDARSSIATQTVTVAP